MTDHRYPCANVRTCHDCGIEWAKHNYSKNAGPTCCENGCGEAAAFTLHHETEPYMHTDACAVHVEEVRGEGQTITVRILDGLRVGADLRPLTPGATP